MRKLIKDVVDVLKNLSYLDLLYDKFEEAKLYYDMKTKRNCLKLTLRVYHPDDSYLIVGIFKELGYKMDVKYKNDRPTYCVIMKFYEK